MIAWRLLWRDLKAGELTLLFVALAVAVMIIVSIGLFTERLQKSLVAETRTFLAADMVLQSPDPVPESWLRADEAAVLKQAQVVQFSSMVFAGDEMYLASVKAVSPAYPLLGDLEISTTAFGKAEKTTEKPQSGEAWVDSRLLGLLNAQLGTKIWVGEKALTITHILSREPDAGSSYWSLGPRLLMTQEDLVSTGVVQEGSRVEYRYLFAGKADQLERYRQWLGSRLGKRHKLLTLQDSQPGLAQSLERAQNFLLLAGSLGVLLAGVAIVMAAKRYSLRHMDMVALLKVLGISTPALRTIIWFPLVPVTLLAIVAGYGLGLLIERSFLWVMREWLPPVLPSGGWKPYVLGATTGVVCVFLFALPALMQLVRISPLRILRRELSSDFQSQGLIYIAGLIVIYGFMVAFSEKPGMVSWIFLGMLGLCALAALAALLLMTAARTLGSQVGSVWRLALAQMQRQQGQSILQLVMFSLILMLLMVSILIRSSLVAEWQQQLPPGTPNQFLINVAPHEVAGVKATLERERLQTAGFFPMVRGRLIKINGTEAAQMAREQVDELFRELNLTWSATLPEDNRVIEGEWWGSDSLSVVGHVSVESGLAKRLGIRVGDRLTFSVGDVQLEAQVGNLRELSWDRMRPNFYFMFSPGSLDEFPATYITSFYLPEEQKSFLNVLLRQFPTLSIFSVDEMIRRIQAMVSQVTRAIEIVLWLILSAGLLVMIAIIQSSLDERFRTSALLRSMGASRGLILGSLAIEFSMLGLCAGLLGAAGCTLTVWLLQSRLFDLEVVFHFWPWIIGPVTGAAIVSATGLFACMKVVRVPPWPILQGSLQ